MGILFFISYQVVYFRYLFAGQCIDIDGRNKMFITCSTTVKTISSSIEVTFCNSTDDDPVQQVFSHLK